MSSQEHVPSSTSDFCHEKRKESRTKGPLIYQSVFGSTMTMRSGNIHTCGPNVTGWVRQDVGERRGEPQSGTRNCPLEKGRGGEETLRQWLKLQHAKWPSLPQGRVNNWCVCNTARGNLYRDCVGWEVHKTHVWQDDALPWANRCCTPVCD